MSPNKRVVIAASKLAACAGLHPYQPREDMVQLFACKYAPHLADARYVAPETQAVKALRSLPQEAQQAVSNAVKSARLAGDAQDATAAASACLQAARVELPACVSELVRSKVATEFGTRAEAGVRAAYGSKHGVRVTKNDEYVEAQEALLEMEGVRLVLGGKHDGLSVDPTSREPVLLEVKNRMNRFLGVPVYEHIQVMAYMQIFNVKRARLVERHGPDAREHEVLFDEVLWGEVVERMRSFVRDALLGPAPDRVS